MAGRVPDTEPDPGRLTSEYDAYHQAVRHQPDGAALPGPGPDPLPADWWATTDRHEPAVTGQRIVDVREDE